MTLAAALIGLIAVIVGGVATGTNIMATKKQNQLEQMRWQQEFDYTREQNELTRQREDNALQRGKLDSMLAGFNPSAALGGMNAGGVSQSGGLGATAPQIQKFDQLNDLLSQYNQSLDTITNIDKKYAEIEKIKEDTKLTHWKSKWEELSQEKQYEYLRMTVDELQTTTIGKEIINNINSRMAQGDYDLQQLEIKANKIYNKILNNEKNVSDAEWQFMETFQVFPNQTETERNAIWRMNGKFMNDWKNNPDKLRDIMRNTSRGDEIRKWIDTGTGIISSGMKSLARDRKPQTYSQKMKQRHYKGYDMY